MSISCVICGGKLDRAGVCPRCGCDLSQCRERYPTLADDGHTPSSISAILSQRFELLSTAQAAGKAKKGPAKAPLVAVAAMLVLVLGVVFLLPKLGLSRTNGGTSTNTASNAATNTMTNMAAITESLMYPESTESRNLLQSGACGEAVTWELYDDGTLIISGSGEITSSPWREDGLKNLVENVQICSGVTSIGEAAFLRCTSLRLITIPNSVTSIGYSAFYYCSGLNSITIPNSVTSIDSHVFWGCTSLDSITIPDSVIDIGYKAFGECTSLRSITIPDSVTSIGNAAFFDCGSLQSISIPDSVTSIGARAFSGCSSLSSVTIPDSVTSIEAYTFSACGALSSITIPNSVISIGYAAFYNCSSLRSILIPDSVTNIGSSAFEHCTGLTDVYFTGTKAQWNKISIGDWNSALTNAHIHYSSN